MSKLYYSLSLIAVVALAASCSNNEVPEQNQAGTTGVQILLNSGATTRAYNASGIADKESNINRVAVAIFKSNGTLNALQEFEASSLSKDGTAVKTPTIKCDAGNNQTILVVANAPAGLFNGVTSPSAFLAKEVVMQDSISADNIPMSGTLRANGDNATFIPGTSLTAPVTFNLVKDQTVTKTIYLSRLANRIVLRNLTVDPSLLGYRQQGSDYYYPYVSAAFLYNAPGKAQVDTMTAFKPVSEYPLFTDLYAGRSGAKSPNRTSGTLTGVGALCVDMTFYYNVKYPDGTDDTAFYFYSFPNNNAYFPSTGTSDATISRNTKLVVQGTDSIGTKSYYPISINSTQGTITSSGDPYAGDGRTYRNRVYYVDVTLKGQGSNSPDIDPLPTAMVANIYVDNWSESTQQVEY
ncbi:MAG: hypothetical protein LBM62_03870 [Mediterranea sp.]|jgi:hypothetical protein|nr:hypothetical protein [Mediterranea sp.]